MINSITGGNKALKDILPRTFLQKYKVILGKYNLLYQEQVTSVNGYSLCIWSQVIKRPFASHIFTQRLPKFYQELQQQLLDDHDLSIIPEATVDQDTGIPQSRPTNDLFRQVTTSDI